MGGKGEVMGFKGISPSFGITFDTHQNRSNLTAEDHIFFHKDGKKAELCNQNFSCLTLKMTATTRRLLFGTHPMSTWMIL